MKQFVVFMCPKCRNFTNAPISQKHRRCSYCGSIIDITKANAALFDGPEQARTAVKEFNAARGGHEFKRAVERSQDRFRSLLPEKPLEVEGITKDDDRLPIPGKQARLMSILQEQTKDRPCTLDQLEALCNAQGLEWTWVEKAIQSLSNSGAIIFPHPWQIQLVRIEEGTSSKERVRSDVATEIISLLRERKKKVRIDDIVRYFNERGVSQESVESSLEHLMRTGDIFQPLIGYVSLV